MFQLEKATFYQRLIACNQLPILKVQQSGIPIMKARQKAGLVVFECVTKEKILSLELLSNRWIHMDLNFLNHYKLKDTKKISFEWIISKT